MILGLETDDTDDLRIGIAFAKFASGDAVLGEVGGIGCRTVLFRIAAEVLDLDLRPFLHLAVMGHILAAAVFQMMNDSLQFHISFCFSIVSASSRPRTSPDGTSASIGRKSALRNGEAVVLG